MVKKARNLEAPLFGWLELFDEHLEAAADIADLSESRYLHTIGPYYYPYTNSRFYFTRSAPAEVITASDLSQLLELDKAVPISREMLSYAKNKREVKKQKSIEELVKDISMCMNAHTEINRLEKHIRYLEICLAERCQIVEQENLYPQEPDNQPEKPTRSNASPQIESGNLVHFILPGTWKKKYEDTFGHFSHDTKVYLIRYREFEKSLERFKKLLADWNSHKWNLTDKCFEDIAAFESKLKTARAGVVIYRNIINRSYVHADYQRLDILILFKYYLETGRADNIQECMNLYEEERHWTEIKESQARIEKTIHLLHKDGVDTGQLDAQVNSLLNPGRLKQKAARS